MGQHAQFREILAAVPECGPAPEVGGQPPLFISRLLRDKITLKSRDDFAMQLVLDNSFGNTFERQFIA